ncbi:MAG: hypothetical protein H6766_04130 [Candidatus Peribacteria bacterium]|nr:MAG: hypothetical protein H6766_04130 [Candidatus Peribacteria bacterium]
MCETSNSLIENDKRTFTYDYQNRLIEANLKNNHEGNQDPYKIEYSYDPL